MWELNGIINAIKLSFDVMISPFYVLMNQYCYLVFLFYRIRLFLRLDLFLGDIIPGPQRLIEPTMQGKLVMVWCSQCSSYIPRDAVTGNTNMFNNEM